MKRNLIISILLFLVFITKTFSLITGHYITNGKGCYAAKSVIGGKSKVCNCPSNTVPVVVGGLLTSVSSCSPDSISFEQIDFYPLPGVIQKKATDYLTSYRIMLKNMNTEKSMKMAELVSTLLEVVRNQSKSLYHQCEIAYLKTYDSLSSEEREKIDNWLKINEYSGE